MDSEDGFKMCVIASVFVTDVVVMTALGLHFDWPSAAMAATAWLGLMALGRFYATRRIDPPVSHLMRETAHLVAFTAVAAVLSYLAAAANRPLVDEWLVLADGLFGFDWEGYVGFVNERPGLGAISSAIYMSTLPQVAVAAILLPMIGLTDRSREFVLAVMFAALIAILVSAILPSAGALAYYRPDASFMAQNSPVVDLAYKDEFYRMRALAIATISLDGAKGLIAFPSYHVALSVLIALAFRGRWAFFIPFAALNFAVILTTPVDGGHHFSDALGGTIVAVFSLVLASRVRAALGPRARRALVPEDEVTVAARSN